MNTRPIENFSAIESDSRENSASMPFFSIGVTTYNRQELLKQTLLSIIKQTFSDFEVIVGNDYIQESLSAELFGIQDSRIRFVNYPQNLKEVGNMNALLRMGRGRYFTWMADDDLYAPNFLEVVHAALSKFDFPPCTFTSYGLIHGANFLDIVKTYPGQEQLFTGSQFLRMYLKGNLKIIGPYGVFDTECLRRIGGIESLSNAPIGLYGEYMLLVRSGLLEKIVYVDAPLVLYRVHEGAWGCTNTDVDQYKRAGENLVRESIKVFTRPELRDDFYQNLSSILELSSNIFVGKLAARDGHLDGHEVMAHLLSLKRQFSPLKGSVLYWLALASLCRKGVGPVWSAAKSKFRSAAPPGLVKLARRVRSFFPRHERRAFWS